MSLRRDFLAGLGTLAPAQSVRVPLRLVTNNIGGDDNSVLIDLVQVLDSQDQVVAGALLNPSFEMPVLGAGGYQYRPSGGVWAFSNSAGIADFRGPFGYYESSFYDGAQFGFVQGSGTISQNMSLLAGRAYRLRVVALNRNQQNNSGNNTLTLNVAGQDLLTETPPLMGFADWVEYRTPLFTA